MTDIALDNLNAIREETAEALNKNPESHTLQKRLQLATDAFNAASKVDPTVRADIYDFYTRLYSRNKNAVALNPVTQRQYDEAVLTSLSQNMQDHIGLKQIDPNKMPYQYRK